MNGICELRGIYSYFQSNLTENYCNTDCLRDSRCVGVYHFDDEDCIQYMYKATASRCYFPRIASHFFHKGNHIVSNFIKFLFNV